MMSSNTPLQHPTNPTMPSVSPDVIRETLSPDDLVGAIYEPVIARGLVGTPLMKTFSNKRTYPGTVISYDVCVANEGAILHLVQWDDPDQPASQNQEHITFSQLLEYHRLRCVHLTASNSTPTPTPIQLRSHQADNPVPSAELTHYLTTTSTPHAPPPHPQFPVSLGVPDHISSSTLLITCPSGSSRYKVVTRQLEHDSTITWHLQTLSDPPTSLHLTNSSFMEVYHLNKSHLCNPPRQSSASTTFNPIANYSPLTDSPSRWTSEHPLCNLLVRVKALPLQVRPPGPSRQTPSTRAEEHSCYVEAVSLPTSLNSTHTLWLRSLHRQDIGFVCLDHTTVINNGTFRFHSAKAINRRFPTIPTPSFHPDPLAPPDLSLPHHQHLRSQLLAFATTLPNTPDQLFGSGYLTTDKPVPHHLRPLYRRAYLHVTSLFDSDEISAIKLLLTLDGMLLAPYGPEVGFGSTLRNRLNLFFAGDLLTLANTTITRRSRAASTPSPPSEATVDSRQAAIAERILTRTGSVRRAAKKLRESPLTQPPSTSSLHASFRDLCPQPGDPVPNPPLCDALLQPQPRSYPPLTDPDISDAAPAQFGFDDFSASVLSHDTGSSPGLSGLSFSTLRTLFSIDDALGQHLAAILNTILSGKTNPITRRLLTAGRAVLIPKSNGGVRPIVVGECIIRLVAHMALKNVTTEMHSHFLPHQLGCGIPSGADAATALIQATLDAHPEWVAISLDVRNAFNTFDRNTTWEPVRAITPSLFPLFAYLYGAPSDQIFTDTDNTIRTIPSTMGSRQGCVLGTFAYAIALQPTLQTINRHHLATRQAFAISYVDDAVIVAPPQEAINVMRLYSRLISMQTLSTLRIDKCHAFSPTHSEHTMHTHFNLPQECSSSTEGLNILGTAVTHSLDFSLAHVKASLEPVTISLSRLPLCSSLQVQFTLLQKSIIHLPMYRTRSTPLAHSPELRTLATTIDATTRAALQRICCPASPLTSTGWQLACFPQSLGGLGLHSVNSLADIAFIARYACVTPFIHTFFPQHTELMPSLPTLLDSPPPATTQSFNLVKLTLHCLSRALSTCPTLRATVSGLATDRPLRHLQQTLSLPIHTQALTSLTASLSERDRALVHSSAGDAHSFSTTPHLHSLTLTNSQFSIAAARRLLQPVYDPSLTPLLCPRCGNQMDPHGDHTLLCVRTGCAVRTRYWHDHVNRTIFHILRSHGERAELEVANLTGDPRLKNKRADILIRSTDLEAPDIICDVRTVVSTQPSILSHSSTTPGYAAARGQQIKQSDWMLAAAFARAGFEALVVEDGGRPGPGLKTLLERTISAHTSSSSERAAALISAWRLVGIANLRGVADCIRLNPAPAHPHRETSIPALYHNPAAIELPPPLFSKRPPPPVARPSSDPPPWVARSRRMPTAPAPGPDPVTAAPEPEPPPPAGVT